MKVGSNHEAILAQLSPGQGLGLTIGNFDGVHLGHQKLLQDFVIDCKNYNLQSLVLTFDPHPKHILNPRDPYAFRLFTIEDLIEQMRKAKIDYLWIQNFNLLLAQLTAEQFIEEFFNKLPIRYLLVGHDFRFGKQRQGQIENLLEWCELKKVPLKIFSPFEIDDQRVSSTLIKNLLLEGDLKSVERFLGRKYKVQGTIVKGQNRGEGIGFPTANLDLSVPLKNGVYATKFQFEGGTFQAITNVGLRPTVNSNMDLWNKNIETHIPGEKLSLYGQAVTVEFQAFIRDEKKFASLGDLKIQIAQDIQALKNFT